MAPGWGAAYNTWLGWEPEWREGYGPLQIAVGVTIVGQELHGVQLEGDQARLQVRTESVRFVSMTFPRGVEIGSPQQINGADGRAVGSGDARQPSASGGRAGAGRAHGGAARLRRVRRQADGQTDAEARGRVLERLPPRHGPHRGVVERRRGRLPDRRADRFLTFYGSWVSRLLPMYVNVPHSPALSLTDDVNGPSF